MTKTAKKRTAENVFIVTVLLLMLLVLLPSKLVMGKDSGKNSESDDPGVVFEDDFTLPSLLSRWPRQNLTQDRGKDVAVSTNGAYRMYNPASEAGTLLALAPSPSTITDASVEVDATRIDDDTGESGSWGVICRASSTIQNLYFLGILNDGTPYIAKFREGEEPSILAVGTPTDAVNEGISVNHIRGDCVENKLILYVNDQKLLEAEDAEFASGGVGLSVEHADISFDNFLVSSL